ncbi:hypothetical protein [Enterobacter hormaechei]|uniref:hypothetical protein n=1 Tax=Enterobacter hormaechei TaxID=158836 RepID=UPI0021BEEBEC|nr:hypothetical protein [Enterobacter hormaechei]
MTVSTVVDHNDYTGNGVTTSFPYTFRIFKKTDLTVSVVDLDENITVLVLDTDYTVTNAGGYNGGNVVLTTPLTNGWQISIARELEPTQETDLRNQGKFFAEVHEDAFDKLTMLIQQAYSVFRLALRKPSSIANWYDALNNYIRNLRDPRDPQDAATKNYVDSVASGNLSRTLRVPEPINQLPSAADRANKMPVFDSAGNAIVVFPPSGSATDVMMELAKPNGVNFIGGALHGALNNDPNISYKNTTSSGEIYIFQEMVSGLNDGFSIFEEELYLTRNGLSYKYSSHHNTLVWPSQYIDINLDVKNSIESIMEYGLNVDLNGTIVKASTINITKDLINGEVVAISDVGSFITVNSCMLNNVRVNCNMKAIRRPVHIKLGSQNPVVKNVDIFDSNGSQLTYGVFIDANSVLNFVVDNISIHNITTIGNGIQGDAIGPCRGILVGAALDPVPSSDDEVSSGVISNIRVYKLNPWEDADGVVIQIYNSSSSMLSGKKIKVDGVYTYNALKRAVKVQANDVTVTNVFAVCDDASATNPMYSCVSVYGSACVVRGVSGRGRIGNGVDSSDGFNTISDVYLKTTATYELSAGLQITSGQVNANNINSEGSRYILAIRAVNNTTPYVNVSGIYGQGYDGAFLLEVRYGFNIGSVYLSDISVSSSNTARSSFFFDILSGGRISLLSVSDVKRISQAFNGADINISGGVTKAIVKNSVFDSGSSSIGVSMTTGTLVASNVSAQSKSYAVNAVQTTNSFINNIDGIVRIDSTTNSNVGLYRGITSVGTNTGLKTVFYQ